MTFYGNASFSFEIHTVHDLIFLIPVADRLSQIKQPVRQRTFAVIYMRNNTKVSYVLHIGGKDTLFQIFRNKILINVYQYLIENLNIMMKEVV